MTTFKIKQEPRPEIMPEIIPDILCDAATKKRYQRGRFLGKVIIIYPFFKRITETTSVSFNRAILPNAMS
jgi:hypothetical protein